MKIGFIHPDLGIGGAQQLVVNLCLAAKKYDYQPNIYTPYHHKSFSQTHDGTIKVHQHGTFYNIIPATIFGRFKGILAYIRTFLCALWVVCFANNHHVIVADQVSFVLPLLRLFRNKTIFYCHFPDKLLAGSRKNILKKLYRFIIDTTQQICLLFAHKIYVNSHFTKEVFYENFPVLRLLKVQVQVLYPSFDLAKFDTEDVDPQDEQVSQIVKDLNKTKYFFSLNRYERKKQIDIALRSYKIFLQDNPSYVDKTKLVIAGGYDPQITENVEHLKELKQLAQQLKIEKNTLFYVSISDKQRKFLLKNCQAVLYTPKNEHFGIVPIEAMYSGVPVLADNSGGPKQTVQNRCGFLIDFGQKQWAAKMWQVMKFGKEQYGRGRDHVIKNFGFQSFAKQFHNGIQQVQGIKSSQ